MSFFKSLFQLCFPAAVFFGLAYYLQFKAVLPETLSPLIQFFPPIAVLLGLLFGWRFNRSRVLWLLLFLVGFERGLTMFSSFGQEFLLALGPVLIPLNLVVIAWWKERGLLTLHGLIRLLFISVQGGLLYWLYAQWSGDLIALVEAPLAPAFPGAILGLSQLGAVVMVFVVVSLLMRYWTRQGALEASFCWVLPCLYFGFLDPGQFAFWGGVATLLMVIAVVEGSFSMAFNDDLTGLPARRAMNEQLLKVGRRYTIAMVDVDHFKKVNDTHGHDVGDQVLKMIAACLSQVTGGGKPFRYGGEEFAVIFSGKDLEEALPHLEELRERISRAGFTLRGRKRPKKKPEKPPKKTGTRKLQVTASIGVACRNEKLATPDDVIKAADEALYKAKKGGRNQVCH